MKPNSNITEEATSLLNSDSHRNENNVKPEIVKLADVKLTNSTECTNPVVRRQKSPSALIVDPQAPRRLSQLFVPLHQDELESEEIKIEDSSNLLANKTKGTPPPRHVSHFGRTLDVNSSTTLENKSISDIESNTSKCTQSSDSSDDDHDDDDNNVLSLDDTICSNRSSYFKHYYLGHKGESRASTRGSSITSVSSLLKATKSAMNDKKTRNRARDDIGLIVLVVVLFLILVIGISLIYYFYFKYLVQQSLFKRLKFNEEKRLLELFDSNGNLDIIAQMGTNLGKYAKYDDCTEYLKFIYSQKKIITTEKPSLDVNDTIANLTAKPSVHEFQFDNETVCLNWNQARVQIHKAPNHDSVNCYNVFWSSHFIGDDLQDCFSVANNKAGVWWGLGELTGGGYPLENVANLPSTRLITSNWKKYPWGKILRRVFVSSKGGLITLPDHLSARISVKDKKLCISANSSEFTNAHRPLTLNYTICSSPDMASTVAYLNFLTEDQNPIMLESNDYDSNLEELSNRIDNPTWIPYIDNLTELSQASVLQYVQSIKYKNKNVIGNILLPVSWQEKIGLFTFDKTRFPDPENFTNILNEEGFHLALTISPIIATDTDIFEEGVKQGYWLKQKDTSLPLLLNNSEGVPTAALTDFTNPYAFDWFSSQIKQIQIQYGITKFYLSAPDSTSISIYHEFDSKIKNPDLYLQSFINSVSSIISPMGADASIYPPPLPTFVTVGSLRSDWNCLETLISRILTLSMLGYPLIDAGPIGGTPLDLPEPELYIRWAQVAAFLPVFTVNVPPSLYSNNTLNIIEKFIKLRNDVVKPRLYDTINNTIIDKYPLIYPLGLKFPNDLVAAAISDEWIIGNDLLIAPILSKGKTSRDIYIPDGLWENQKDGRLKRGPGWMRNYEVPLTDIAYFIKRYSVILSG